MSGLKPSFEKCDRALSIQESQMQMEERSGLEGPLIRTLADCQYGDCRFECFEVIGSSVKIVLLVFETANSTAECCADAVQTVFDVHKIIGMRRLSEAFTFFGFTWYVNKNEHRRRNTLFCLYTS
ncbi:Cytochrome P450 71B19 [Frankliniella fusca]|uniref:Cytochrome P450 71B19 n=1 Tax=Frankliniella fusca TaxID=407009 RepID=A0AAE1HBI7_9NEOP|nr:Cytochrome P450 71B19 [Frankliniella fusca]